MKKINRNHITLVVGLLLLSIGIILITLITNRQDIFVALPYICIGVGCGTIGQSLGNIINNRTLEKTPDAKKVLEIEKNDERNIAICNASKAKAYDMMTYIFGILILVYALMGVNMIALLLLIGAYLLIIFYGLYNRFKYEKLM